MPCISTKEMYRECRYEETHHINGETILEVNMFSAKWLHKYVYRIAGYFRTEFDYTIRQYDLWEDDENCIAYLFTNKRASYRYYVYGACCFRKRKYSNLPEAIWELDWIWLHPYERDKGILSHCLPFFNKKFGYWYPSEPHSKAMTAFVNKYKIMHPCEKFLKNILSNQK
jgi:hypothetical protein